MIETVFFIILFFSLFIYKNYSNNDVITITLENGNKYVVRNVLDSKDAALILDKIKSNLILLVDNIIDKEFNQSNNNKIEKIEKIDQESILNKTKININNNSNYNDYLKKIKKKLKTVKISESSIDTSYTSYSINKGEELVFCIRSKIDGKIHDINELMYVAVHEIAHIGCPEVGHTDLFREINYYLLNKAKEYKLYNLINYEQTPLEYCGLTLNNNLLNR